MIEARPPDGSAFDRAYYRTVLTLMGERTDQQRTHIDIHNAPVALGSGSLNGVTLANQGQNVTHGELGELSQQFPRVLFNP